MIEIIFTLVHFNDHEHFIEIKQKHIATRGSHHTHMNYNTCDLHNIHNTNNDYLHQCQQIMNSSEHGTTN